MPVPEGQGRFWTQLGVVVIIASLAVIGVVVFLQVPVCEEELSDAGKVIEVCRSMTLTDFPMVVLGLAIISLLGFFFTEIEGFGFKLKREVAKAKESADQAKDAAEVTREQVFTLRNEVSNTLTSVQRQIAQQNVNVNLFGPAEEESFGLREVWPLASLVEEMDSDLRGEEEYVVGRTTYAIPPEFLTASEIAGKLARGDRVSKSEIDAMKVSIRETARRYNNRLSERTGNLLLASGALTDASGSF